jgi:hypothetical protein
MAALTNNPTRDIYQARLRENPRACPHCGSKDLVRFKPRRYAVFNDRRCQACSCQWTPAWPKVAAFALLLAVLAEVCGSGYVVWMFSLGELASWRYATEMTIFSAVLTLVVLCTLTPVLRFLFGVLGGTAGGPWIHNIEDEWLKAEGAGQAAEPPVAEEVTDEKPGESGTQGPAS